MASQSANWFRTPLHETNYLVHWSKAKRYIYVETPKVGCTSVKRALQYSAVGGDESRLPEQVHDRAGSPIERIVDDLDGFYEAIDSPQYFRFCFVRNPFTRVLSAYLDKMVDNDWERNRLAPKLGLPTQPTPSFIDFLTAVSAQEAGERDIHWRPQAYILNSRKIRYDLIGRFESFSGDFSKILRKLDIAVPESIFSYGKKHETGATKKIDEYLNEDAINLIRRLFAEDFDTYGYGWSPPL